MRLLCGVQGLGQDAQVRYQVKSPVPGWDVLSISLRSDLVVVASRLDGGLKGHVNFEIDDPPVHFGSILLGKNRCAYASGKLKNRELLRQAGDNSIVCLPKTRGTMECDPNAGACVVSVLASPAFLSRYLADGMDDLPGPLRKVLEGRPEQLLWHGRRTPLKTALLGRIMQSLGCCPMRRLMLESMVLEFLSLQVDECCRGAGGEPSPVQISKGDEERLREASRLLVMDLENPPGLEKLARTVGLSEKKLKYGFRQLFGVTVYEHFRNHRLERARVLLDADRLSVSEVAYSVGYLNLSHFSAAFRQRYGMNPSDYLRRSRHS